MGKSDWECLTGRGLPASSPQVRLLECVEVQSSGSLAGHRWEARAVVQEGLWYLLPVCSSWKHHTALLPLFLKERQKGPFLPLLSKWPRYPGSQPPLCG